MNRSRRLLTAIAPLLLVASCGSGLDDAEATRTFGDCLARHGTVYDGLVVTVEAGKVSGITVSILTEGTVDYEPGLRLACSMEVEGAG